MPYDPTKPANNSPIVAVELRDQFAGLKDLIDTKVDDSALISILLANSAGPCPDFPYLNLAVSNPPTQAQVQAIADRLDELVTLLKRA